MHIGCIRFGHLEDIENSEIDVRTLLSYTNWFRKYTFFDSKKKIGYKQCNETIFKKSGVIGMITKVICMKSCNPPKYQCL